MLALPFIDVSFTLNILPMLLVIVPLLLSVAAFTRLLSIPHQLAVGLPFIVIGNALGIGWVGYGSGLAIDGWLLGGWALPLGIRWTLEPTSLALLTLTTVVAVATSLSSLTERIKRHEHWTLWWLMWAALNTLWLSRDLFNVYVALELLSLSAAGLVALSPKDPYGFSALRYVLVALIASLFYLLGVGLMYGTHATLDIDLLSERASSDTLHAVAALCMTLGLMMKAALVPLHSWLPQAHSRASPGVSAMLSAVVVAVALYWLWQLWLGPFQVLSMQPLFAFLGGLSLLWGGINALQQTQLKRLIAYSTISQMGYALLVLSLSTDASSHALAQQGATTLLVAHGLAKAGLFLTAGYLVIHHQGDQLQRLTGSAYQHPWLWAGFALCAASLVGLPPSGGFVGKWWLFMGLWEQQRWLSATAFLLGTLLTAGYLARVIAIALRPAPIAAATARSYAELLPLLLGCLAWGLGITLVVQASYLSLPDIDRTSRFFALPALLIWGLILFWQSQCPSPRSRFFTVLLWLTALFHAIALTAQDWLMFYAALAWLGILGWLLILHGKANTAPQAGRTYLAMMLIAEVLLFAATASMALQETLAFEKSTLAILSVGTALLVGGGLAIKSGVLGVHGWLPVAHPAAPALASALLSGVMIKLGILGVLRLTPDNASAVAAGEILFYWGVLAALYGGVQGTFSRTPKAVLAWSSVGQIGLLSAGVGILLLVPDNDPLRTLIMLLVISHGLAKSALFIGAGQWAALSTGKRQIIGAGMAVAALTLVGAPLSGGLYIKSGLTYAINSQGLTGELLTLASVATAGAMLRFGWLLLKQPTADACLGAVPLVSRWLWAGWWLLCAGAWLVPLMWQWWLPYPGSWMTANLKALAVVAISGSAAAATLYLRATLPIKPLTLSPITPLSWHQATRSRLAWRVERQLRHWPVIGIMLISVTSLFLILYL